MLVRMANRRTATDCSYAGSLLHYDCNSGQKGARVEHFLLTRAYLVAGNDLRYASTASASAWFM